MRRLKLTVVVSSIFLLLAMSACDHDITTSSTVYEDGSIDRTILLYDADTASVRNNVFDINKANGWTTTIEPALKRKRNEKDEQTNNITFKKHFASVTDANLEMDRHIDTLFSIRSTFQKKSRWFYTYLEYTDTYSSLNRFNALPMEDYFTREDYAFIDRLPAEGKPISKADSIFLARLNEKIFDVYGARTIFEELYGHLLQTMRETNVPEKWEDSLFRKKEQIYQKFVETGNDENHNLLVEADHLKIPLSPQARAAFLQRSAEVENRIEFVSDAYSGKYHHIIRMPWPVVETNADSVNSQELHWSPPVIKFLLNDYAMTARSRKINIWAMVTSAGVILITFSLFYAQRRRTLKV
jgi:hypothetical protein